MGSPLTRLTRTPSRAASDRSTRSSPGSCAAMAVPRRSSAWWEGPCSPRVRCRSSPTSSTTVSIPKRHSTSRAPSGWAATCLSGSPGSRTTSTTPSATPASTSSPTPSDLTGSVWDRSSTSTRMAGWRPVPTPDAKSVQRLEEACRKGNASCFTSGIDPGFANDLLPLTLTGFCERIDSVRVIEILNYNTYMQPEVIFETMGFGQPMDHTPLLLLPGILTSAWGPVVQVLAAGLGVEVEEVRETYDRLPADEMLDTAVGQVEKGTVAGLRL